MFFECYDVEFVFYAAYAVYALVSIGFKAVFLKVFG